MAGECRFWPAKWITSGSRNWVGEVAIKREVHPIHRQITSPGLDLLSGAAFYRDGTWTVFWWSIALSSVGLFIRTV